MKIRKLGSMNLPFGRKIKIKLNISHLNKIRNKLFLFIFDNNKQNCPSSLIWERKMCWVMLIFS